ncbi:MAG: hypothetical protein AAF587_00335 [Bacteroidota bacterium]
MRPKLKVSRLTNLQDARSSAAVGFDMISFSLERGSSKKLPSSSIWSIVNWLSGPDILIELNVASLDELQDVQKTMELTWVSLPVADWDLGLRTQLPSQLILRADQSSSADTLLTHIQEAHALGIQVLIELDLSSPTQVEAYTSLLPHTFLHFPALDMTQTFAATSPLIPYGFSLGEEAEEEPNQLDYERIDDFMEVFEARFG